MARDTTYLKAVNWLHNQRIHCDNILDIDPSVIDNARFSFEEDGVKVEIFQWFLTDASEEDVEWLEKSFKLKFSYSNKLELFVLCVDHCGTPWDAVDWKCYNDDIGSEWL